MGGSTTNGADISDVTTNSGKLQHQPPSWAHSNTGDIKVNLRVEHAVHRSHNRRTTIQLAILKNVPQEKETTPSGGRSMVQTGEAGQFDGDKRTLASLDVVETQQETPWLSTSITHP